MEKFATSLTKGKGKASMNEWGNDDSDIHRVLYGVYENIRTILFPYLVVNLFKHRCISSVKSYKYLNKFISIKTGFLTF